MYHPVFAMKPRRLLFTFHQLTTTEMVLPNGENSDEGEALADTRHIRFPFEKYAKTDEGGALAVTINPNQDHNLPTRYYEQFNN